MSGAPRRVRVGIDTGGTFTDVVAFDEDTGEVVSTKTPSTPADPAEGFLEGLRKILAVLGSGDGSGAAGAAGGVGHGGEGGGPVEITAVCHGTTVATNQLLEGRTGRIGFITTEGFEFLLEIARQSVPDGYGNSYFWVKPPRIVPADLVRTVGGRLDHTGAELRPFDTEGARAVARWFRDRGVTTLGVCLLHAYADARHERLMRQILAEEHPDAVVSLSSDVLREYREYERAMTTLVDAAVKPKVAGYVAGIRRRLAEIAPSREPTASEHVGARQRDDERSERGGEQIGAAPAASEYRRSAPPRLRAQRARRRAMDGVPFYIMKSNGGVLSAEEVVHQPITTVLSGPAAGALGAALVARTAGFDRVLTLDGGGTSTDVSVVLHGEPTLTTEGSVGGYPSKIPMIDVVTVGAGGGSIAWLSREGTLKVGPRSAGADPGPLCYRRGGVEPTVTDAHLVLGRIPPHLLGGEVPLSVEAARDGLSALGAKLNLDLPAAAAGILEISAWNQANALRQVTVKRGLDVRDFVLTTFGGSGSLLACRLADILGLPAVVVPREPGNLSAFGLLTVDVKNDYVQTYVVRHAALDAAAVQGHFTALQEAAAHALDAEGFDRDRHRYARSADLRYFGQAFEVRVPVPDGQLDADAVAAAFHDAHEQTYGYCFRDRPEQQVEWVNLRVTGVGPIRRPTLRAAESGPAAGTPVPAGTRPVCFDRTYADTPIFQRTDLPPGATIPGPAVIEEYGSTVPVHPGFQATVDPFANLVLTRA